ncbi:MAG: adenine deaminase [Bacteroidetes bacterium]|nr:adenine deaminase [Bacteroidota bacterium]
MNQNHFVVSGNIVDVVNSRIFQGIITIENGKIISVVEEQTNSENYILPGLVDAHVHIESSMLIPSEFAKLAVVHGTVATVSDPHEIANVLGVDGVKWMINNGKKVPFKFYFGAPSCVPATGFETSGAILGTKETQELLEMKDIHYLAEMMNFPGVIYGDAEVAEKLRLAKLFNKPIDGHAPGLMGDDLGKYANAGITTDHECSTIAEAVEKIKLGIKVQIREGSAAKNFEDLFELINDYPEDIMFCSDDKHPDDLEKGHINLLIKRAIAKGVDPLKIIRCCTYNPIKHYKMNVGLLQKNDDADFIIVDNLKDFNVLKTFISGNIVAENKISKIESVKETEINIFNCSPISIADIQVKADPDYENIKVIKVEDGQLLTQSLIVKPKIENGFIVPDLENDVLKMVVLNRYEFSKPAVAFVNNFGFQKGAIASTIAHDSHNIIAVGTSDEEIVKAINIVIEKKGGISLVNGSEEISLKLGVAGLMSSEDAYQVSKKYFEISNKSKTLGTKLNAPYMTLSFMALLVIPELKLSDKGLFDGNAFKLTKIYC